MCARQDRGSDQQHLVPFGRASDQAPTNRTVRTVAHCKLSVDGPMARGLIEVLCRRSPKTLGATRREIDRLAAALGNSSSLVSAVVELRPHGTLMPPGCLSRQVDAVPAPGDAVACRLLVTLVVIVMAFCLASHRALYSAQLSSDSVASDLDLPEQQQGSRGLGAV